MGVSGSGKSTIGSLLANDLGGEFFDGDDYHPQENVDKMAQGLALDDNDRQGWLRSLRDLLASRISERKTTIIGCSALRIAYRDLLSEAGPLQFLHLDVDRKTLENRMTARTDHFMPASLLDSQLTTLELSEDCLVVDAAQPVGDVVAASRALLRT